MLLALLMQLCVPSGLGVCRYVDPNGNDSNMGSITQPYRTIQRAADLAQPGDVIVVRNGTYTGGNYVVTISRSGTATNRIMFKSENKYGAVIDGRNNSSDTGIEISGFFIRVESFEIKNTSHYGIEAYQGGNVEIVINHVHDIGHYCTSTSNGIVGINAYVSNLLIEQNVVHDIGRWASGQNGCSTSNDYWMNHDHGVYHGQGDNVIIKNNIFYNFTRGWPIQRYDGNSTIASNLQILNNTFVGANPNRDGQIIIATATRNLTISNNIFYKPTNAGIWFDASGNSGTVSNNLVYGARLFVGSTNGITIANNMIGDPLFVDINNHDFSLQPASIAISKGIGASAIAAPVTPTTCTCPCKCPPR